MAQNIRYPIGKCPLCHKTSMAIIFEQHIPLIKSYWRYRCENPSCECGTDRSKVPLRAISTQSASYDYFIMKLADEWKDREKYFSNVYNRKPSKRGDKILIGEKLGRSNEVTYREYILLTCPICGSHEVLIYNDYDTSQQYVLCKQCSFHTKKYPISENIDYRRRMVMSWNSMK